MGIKARILLNVCQSVTSPMLVGFFRPVVLLPPVKIVGDEMYSVLKHELIHFQRRDLWGKALILAAAVLHWFNPAVYLMVRSAAAQCEISCDERTLQGADFYGRKQYGETIIGVARNGARLRTALSTNFYGGKKGMKDRIFAIMDTKRKKVGVAIFCMVLAGVITIGTAVVAVATGKVPAAASNRGVRITGDGIAIAKDAILGDNQTGLMSTDGGQTWMGEEEFHKLYLPSDLLSNIEWWTYDEYKAYIKEQKEILPGMIGATGGYYDEQDVLHEEVWTQKKVDEAIQRHEEILEPVDIK
jgi:hypothetical protein